MQKIRQNQIKYFGLQFLIVFFPILLKLLAGTTIGSMTLFYFIFAWAPATLLVFSWLRGKEVFLFASLVLNLTFAGAILNYPNNPPMDFQRQVAHGSSHIMFLALVLIMIRQFFWKKNWSRK